MNRKDALKIRAARALDIIRVRGDDDDWEKLIEMMEEQALTLSRQAGAVGPPGPSARARRLA